MQSPAKPAVLKSGETCVVGYVYCAKSLKLTEDTTVEAVSSFSVAVSTDGKLFLI